MLEMAEKSLFKEVDKNWKPLELLAMRWVGSNECRTFTDGWLAELNFPAYLHHNKFTG